MKANSCRLFFFVPMLASLMLVVVLNTLASELLLAQRQSYDRVSLQQFFEPGSYDNDVLLDAYLIPSDDSNSQLVNLELLGLQRDRLAYRARRDGEVFALAIPATVDDGFNGTIDLLVSVDMFGRIGAARVIEDLDSANLYGVLDIIDSKWMEEFSGNSMRDILGISWTPITADREYDQFVGASITPKAVANRIYDALVFYQSNRIELMRGAAHGL